MADNALTLIFQQRPGAADRILSLLRRRSYPVAGLTIERTHQAGLGRMTVVVGQPAMREQMSRHLRRLPDVVEVRQSDGEVVHREYALARVCCTPQQRTDLISVLSAFHARAISITDAHVVVEATGEPSELDDLFAQLETYGIEELARTNPIALRRIPEDATRQTA